MAQVFGKFGPYLHKKKVLEANWKTGVPYLYETLCWFCKTVDISGKTPREQHLNKYSDIILVVVVVVI